MTEHGWKPGNTDFDKSPYTGMNRASWIEAGKYLLTGIFKNIPGFEDPVLMPRYETEVTYPNEGTPSHKVQAELFEGLARSFFLAAPLIHIEPQLVLEGFSIRDYYKNQVLRACTKGDPLWVLDMETMGEMEGGVPSSMTFQQTVESCALVICLWLCREEIWDTYTREEKDRIAGLLRSYGEGTTIPHNWRFFNMLDLAFLHMEGYDIDQDKMRDHAQTVLNYYAGDGWYRDGQSFDYYSCWAFQVYAPLWNLWYGYEQEPYLAARFEENSNRLMDTYPFMFDRDGYTNMWGRSNIYRNGATASFFGNFLLKNPTADPGLARRISSGSLLQFMGRDDWLYKGVPVLGFYGKFLPMVQSYSCAESPFWLAKAFLCLHLPEDHPFWTAREHNGVWEEMKDGEVKTTLLDGPGLCISNHQANGATQLRTGKVLKKKDDIHGMWNYSKLVYNTKFPWEAQPDPEIESQQYVYRDLLTGSCMRGNVTAWYGEKHQVLYRRSFLGFDTAQEIFRMPVMDLADFTVPYGLIRADKMRFPKKPAALTLGAFGFPDNGTKITRLEQDGFRAAVLKGHDHMGRERQLAMTIFAGWDNLAWVKSRDTNPDSPQSIVVYGELKRQKLYGYEPYILISQVLTKDSLEEFRMEEIFPIKEINYTDRESCGGYGPVTIVLQNGTERVIDYYGIEGTLMI